MLNYFNKTSPSKWTLSGALEEAAKAYPDKLRAYHLHLVKDDLRTIASNNSNEAQQKKAIELINNWHPPKESSAPKQASTIVNKAIVQTNYQATYQTITQENVSSQEETSSSFIPSDSSSEDDTAYTARPATFDYLVSTNTTDEVSSTACNVEWILNNDDNLSRAFMEKRNTLIETCRSDKRKLSTQEQLALSGILLLDDRHQSDFLSNTHYVQACRELKLKYGQFADAVDPPMHDVYNCVELIRNGDSSKVEDLLDTSSLPIRFKTILFSLNRTYGASYSIKNANENTIIKDYLLPMLDPFFPNTEYSTSFAADKEIEQSNNRFISMDPSLAKHVKKADYSIVHNATKYTLLILEAKSCKQQHKSATDLIKIGKYLKDTIDAAESKGFRELKLVGLISSGEHVDAYLLAHDHDYIYTMYKLYTFHIPIDRTDIHRCVPALSIIPRLAKIILASVDLLNQPKRSMQSATLRRLETYHTPIALPDQRTKRVPNIHTSPKFKAAKRKLF
ncbi:unnamed protein product [Mucor fragilis]